MNDTTHPLRHVGHITVSEESGTQLNPNYFWLTREYTLHLDCGHHQTRARTPFHGGIDPKDLNQPLPRRVRCNDCTPVTKNHPRRTTTKPTPTYDPAISALIKDMCHAQPDRQDMLLNWINQHGRYQPDETRRHRAYAAVARTIIDTYLPDTDNTRATEVREAIEQWYLQPTEHTRTAVRTAAKRLYNTQDQDGEWFAHRGIIAAAKLASPHPHAADAVTEAPTWDTETRREWSETLWGKRVMHDCHQRYEETAFLSGDTEAEQLHAAETEQAARELDTLVRHHQPRIEPQHMALCHAMLTAYQAQL